MLGLGVATMRLKWKVLTLWITAPYLFYALIIPGIMWLSGYHSTLSSALHWKVQSLILVYCAVPASFGTLILWALPIRRALLNVMGGLILAIGGLALCAWFGMTFFGGFEENMGIFVTAVMLLIPSCFMGAIAGFLRFREQQSEKPQQDSILSLK
jgi:hypothetical protein